LTQLQSGETDYSTSKPESAGQKFSEWKLFKSQAKAYQRAQEQQWEQERLSSHRCFSQHQHKHSQWCYAPNAASRTRKQRSSATAVARQCRLAQLLAPSVKRQTQLGRNSAEAAETRYRPRQSVPNARLRFRLEPSSARIAEQRCSSSSPHLFSILQVLSYE